MKPNRFAVKTAKAMMASGVVLHNMPQELQAACQDEPSALKQVLEELEKPTEKPKRPTFSDSAGKNYIAAYRKSSSKK
jgi:hypothetical protein